MTRAFALRLAATPDDLAALRTLARVMPDADAHPWRALAPADSGPYAITSPALTRGLAARLADAGADVCALREEPDVLTLTALRDARLTRWSAPVTRDAPSLLEAVRPVAAGGDPAVDVAILCVPATTPAGVRTLHRLLALGRDDVALTALHDGEGETLLVRVSAPPMYLLLRARDEPDEAVRAYARQGDDALWVRWGHRHPLAEAATERLRRNGLRALIDPDGAWRTLPADAPTRPLHAALAPTLDALRATLTVDGHGPRIAVTLRLEPDAPREPEAWLLDADALLRLEPLIDALDDDALRRFSLCRLAGDGGPRYLLREQARPGAPRHALAVVAQVGDAGFCAHPQVSSLLLRAGTRLVPPLRAPQLRALLDLDGAHATLLDLDPDGPRITAVRGAPEWTLADWVDLVATDRRLELDRLAETSVFDWLPEVTVAPRVVTAAPEAPRAPRTRSAPVAPTPGPPAPAPPSPQVSSPEADAEALAAMERERVRGPRDDAAAWSALGLRKLQRGDRDDAAACLEAALFHGGARADLALALRQARAQSLAPHGFSSIATRGADALARLAAGEPPPTDAEALDLTRALTAPDAPASRWLAWSVLRALHTARGDAVELTRARERLLGAVNAHGLRAEVDLPRFARRALADPTQRDDGSLDALNALWSALNQPPLDPGTALDAYARAIVAAGMHRVGAPLAARALTAPVALDALAPANRALLGLYLARPAHDDGAWPGVVTAALDALRSDAHARDRVEHLRTRSEWLRGPAATAAPRLRPALTRALAEVDATPTLAPQRIAEALRNTGLYDLEVATVLERCLDVAIAAGDPTTLRDALRACERLSARVTSATARARALGASVRAAAALGDEGMVAGRVGDVAALLDDPRAPPVLELLDALAPALLALHRFGVGPLGARLTDALTRAADRGGLGPIRLRAAAADAMRALRRDDEARAARDRGLDEVLAPGVDPLERYPAARALLASLRHLPLAERAPRCARLASELHRFHDTFTASKAGLYETHKVLLLERLVDALADHLTLDGDALRALLDDEELALRRRIHADWSAACGP
ncbi:MAG: hypothetical protein U0325_01745 [Polyangiales bacterium]